MISPLIQYITIFTRDGKSLLFRNYGSLNIDRDIIKKISNFVSIESQSKIKYTITGKFKYFYTSIDRIIIVICSDLEDDDAVINSKLTKIKLNLIEKYEDVLKGGRRPENLTIFTRFERVIDDTFLSPIKVAIIGMGRSGKTDVVRLICGKDINLEYQPTINVDISSCDGSEIGVNRSIELWDFAGQSNFKSLWGSLLDSTDIALLVMDSTFENVNQSKEIIQDILDKSDRGFLIIGIANEQDKPNRLTPKFCEDILSQTKIEPPIKVQGMIAIDPTYREKILAILRDAIYKIYNTSEPNLKPM